jgi:hypothetical protein
VELPADVYAAGPVPITVTRPHLGRCAVQLDGVDAGELVAAGDGIFEGELPVHGAIDNGPHEVEVIATQGKLEDTDRPLQRPDAQARHRGVVAWPGPTAAGRTVSRSRPRAT